MRILIALLLIANIANAEPLDPTIESLRRYNQMENDYWTAKRFKESWPADKVEIEIKQNPAPNYGVNSAPAAGVLDLDTLAEALRKQEAKEHPDSPFYSEPMEKINNGN